MARKFQHIRITDIERVDEIGVLIVFNVQWGPWTLHNFKLRTASSSLKRSVCPGLRLEIPRGRGGRRKQMPRNFFEFSCTPEFEEYIRALAVGHLLKELPKRNHVMLLDKVSIDDWIGESLKALDDSQRAEL